MLATDMARAAALGWILCQGSPPTWKPAQDRVKLWSEDVRQLAEELPKLHKNLFFHLTKGDWEKRVAALEKDLPSLSDERALVRLMELVAAVNDGHTAVQIGKLEPRIQGIPVKLIWFTDGLYCVASSDAEMVGKRIVKIEGEPADKALERIAAAIPLENESARRYFPPDYAALSEILTGCGLSPKAGAARFTFDKDGKETESVLTAVSAASRPRIFDWLSMTKSAPPLRHKKRDAYWAEPLMDAGAVYIQYNQCRSLPGKPFADFAKEALAMIDATKAKRVVFDVRNNTGGDSSVATPLLEGLVERKGRVQVAVLTSRATLSSAVLNSEFLRSECGAAIVGEPYGQRATHYGEMRTMTLKNTGIQVSYSTKLFKIGDGSEASCQPTVPVSLTAKDYFAGKDPWLDAALK
jgi:hypothetical protein